MKEFRGGIIRLFEQGKSGYQIAKDMKLPYTTVRDTIRRYRETGNYNDRPRCGDRELLVHQLKLEKSRAESSILENEACSKPRQSIEALKKSLVKAWNAIPQEVIDRAVDDFPKRLKKCIDAQGGHFENK